MRPVAGDAQPLEFLALHLDPMAREVAALGAELLIGTASLLRPLAR